MTKQMKHFSEITPAAERIVDAAESLIRSVGYNGFSYEDVSRMVGIRKPSVHHHFPTKGELGVIVVQRYTHRFAERLEEIGRRHATSAGRLQAYCDLFSETFAAGRSLCICGMLGAESNAIPDVVHVEVRRFFEHNAAWLADVLKQGAQAGEIKLTSPPEMLADFLLSALEGSMLLGRGRQIDQGPRHVAEVFLASLR